MAEDAVTVLERLGVPHVHRMDGGTLRLEVLGDVNLAHGWFEELPDFSGAIIHGNFYIGGNRLISLKGSPRQVDGNFSCWGNQLSALEGGPQVVLGTYDCSGNGLKSLLGAPAEIYKSFNCSNNALESLEYGPGLVGDAFQCYGNPLQDLGYAPISFGHLYSDCGHGAVFVDGFMNIPLRLRIPRALGETFRARLSGGDDRLFSELAAPVAGAGVSVLSCLIGLGMFPVVVPGIAKAGKRFSPYVFSDSDLTELVSRGEMGLLGDPRIIEDGTAGLMQLAGRLSPEGRDMLQQACGGAIWRDDDDLARLRRRRKPGPSL